METKFSARQKQLNLSQCERLCDRPSSDVEALARRSGWRGMPGDKIIVPVKYALNMLILSKAMNYGVEPSVMVPWLPGLRNEALLKLGEEISNWSFAGPADKQMEFFPMLYGSRESVRPKIARLLECQTNVTIQLLRFFSETNVECLSETHAEQVTCAGIPRFCIDAHELSDRVQSTCGYPLFTVET